MRGFAALLVASGTLALYARGAGATPDAPDCSLYSNATLMSWPAEAPVWQFCWRRMPDSAPLPNGSGVELLDVFYNGHRVFDRMSVPILNVEYAPGGCGCFRDWLYAESSFEAVGLPCADGYCEVIQPARTMCDCAPTDTCDADPDNECNVDLGSFRGVAADKQPDRLILTSGAIASWYRYMQVWTFYLDGSIEPEFGFSATPNGCTDTMHVHHAYYRLDFDIDGPGDDQVIREVVTGAGLDTDGDGVEDDQDNCTQVANADRRDTNADGYGNACDGDLDNDGIVNFVDVGSMKAVFFGSDPDADLNGDGFVNFTDVGILKSRFFLAPGPSGVIPQEVLVTTEEHAYSGSTVSWLAQDAVTGRGYRLIPGPHDQALPVTTFDPAPFAKADYWVLAEHSDELSDDALDCRAQINNFANGEATDGADVVLWYRLGDAHEADDHCHCGRAGPRLVPVGDWFPVGYAAAQRAAAEAPP